MSCLDNPDVRLKIFEHVFTTNEGHRDLATLARACRTFHAPALSLLWRTQMSLAPLILCFPVEILDVSKRVDPRGDSEVISVTFAKPPSLEDWERPLMSCKIHQRAHTALETLFNSCPDFPLLPRLRHLDCRRIFPNYNPRAVRVDAQVASAHVFKISSPAVLEALTLRLYYDWRPSCNPYDDGRGLLEQVLERYPTIKSLTIDNARVFTAGNGSVLPTDLSIVGSFQSLTSFTFNGRLPESFDLVPSFPAILKLDLACYASSALHFLKAIISPRLRDIRLCLWNSPGDDSDWVLELCAVLASRASWQESIRSIIFIEISVSSKAFEILFVLRHLVRLDLCCPTIDDDLVERAAKAWTMLESVAIFDEYTECPTSTLQSLVSLSRHCPRLRSIIISLDANQIPPLTSTTSGSKISQTDLGSKKVHGDKVYLGITGYSEVSDPAGVAGFLIDLFHGFNLKIVYDCGDEDPEWQEVAQIIDRCQKLKIYPNSELDACASVALSHFIRFTQVRVSKL
ncbi:hypothetical protein JVU11DRAFT_7760 [Chiua virens]|nr:hypothetical protein JVU11DRAFT_7760 [Chiua virens]